MTFNIHVISPVTAICQIKPMAASLRNVEPPPVYRPAGRPGVGRTSYESRQVQPLRIQQKATALRQQASQADDQSRSLSVEVRFTGAPASGLPVSSSAAGGLLYRRLSVLAPQVGHRGGRYHAPVGRNHPSGQTKNPKCFRKQDSLCCASPTRRCLLKSTA